MKIKLVVLAVPLALLAACSTQPSTEAEKSEAQSAARAAEQPGARTGATASRGMTGDAVKDKDAKVAKRSVYYELDKSDLNAEQRSTVERNAAYLSQHPDVKVRVEGNADERGSREYNLALGQRRAESVMKTMSLLGVAPSRMESVSYGEEKPRETGHDETSWSENRRSDIVYP